MDEENSLLKQLRKGQRERDPKLVALAAEQFRLLGDRENEAACLDVLAEMSFSAGSHVEAAKYLRQSLEIYQDLGLKKGQAQALYWLSRCLVFVKGAFEIENEISLLISALAVATEVADIELQIQCCLRLGACYRSTEAARASSYYQDALKLLEKLEKGWISGICHQSLAHIFAASSDNLKARKHYLAAIEDFELDRSKQPANVDLRQAQCFESLGDLALRVSDEDEASERYESSLQKLESLQSRGSQRVREKLEQLHFED